MTMMVEQLHGEEVDDDGYCKSRTDKHLLSSHSSPESFH